MPPFCVGFTRKDTECGAVQGMGFNRLKDHGIMLQCDQDMTVLYTAVLPENPPLWYVEYSASFI